MNMIHLSRAEYNTLSTIGTLTKGGVTYTFDPINNEYIVPTTIKYLHNVILSKSGADYYAVRASFQIINDSPDTIDTAEKLFNALNAILPTANMYYPCNILYTRSTDYSESATYIFHGSDLTKFEYQWGPAIHTFLDSAGTVYRGGADIGGTGSTGVRDTVIEL